MKKLTTDRRLFIATVVSLCLFVLGLVSGNIVAVAYPMVVAGGLVAASNAAEKIGILKGKSNGN